MTRDISAFKKERILKGFYQVDLAAQTRIPLPYISLFENGKRMPNAKEAAVLAQTLGITPKKIFALLKK